MVCLALYTYDMTNPNLPAGPTSRKESIMDLLLRTTINHPAHGVVTVEIDNGEFFPGVYPLTQCCEAAATGLGSGGIGCKGCYNLVPEWFAMFANDLDGLKATIA